MIPLNNRPLQTFASLRTTVPVAAKAWKIVSGSHFLPISDFYACSNTELQLVRRSQSLAIIHPPHLCDDKAPDHVWLYAISMLALGIGRANPQGR